MHINTVFRVGWRYLLRHPWQSGLLILGITLGVAVLVAIDLANASAGRAFDLSTDAVAGRATHQILGGPTGFDEQIYVDLLRAGIPAELTPIVSANVSSAELGNRPFTLLGVDPFTEAPFRNYFGKRGEIPLGSLTVFLTRPGSVLLSSEVASRYGLAPCPNLLNPDVDSSACRFTLNVNGYLQEVYLSGLLEPADALSRQALDSLVVTDIATAQELTRTLDRLARIDVLMPSVSPEDGSPPPALALIERILPPDVRIQDVAARSGSIAEMTSAFRVNLTALSLLALLVGMFLIYNTMTFSVIQRRPMFGTLRCLGATRSEIFRMVVGEALLFGLIGTTLGLALGVILGQGAVLLVTRTINDLFFVVNVRGVQIPTESLFKGALVGLITTILAAAPPAWEAASVPPRLALFRSGLEDKAQKVVGWVALVGVFLIAAGVLFLLGIETRNLVISFTGTFAVIIGLAMLTPWLSARILEWSIPLFGRVWGSLGRMAPRDVYKSISRTSIAVAALMVAVSVTIGVSLMIDSFRSTVQVWLAQTLQGDIYVSSPAAAGAQIDGLIEPPAVQAIRDLTGVADLAQLRSVELDSPGGPINLTAIDRPVREAKLFLSADGSPAEIWAAMQDGAVIVSEPFASRFNLPAHGGIVQLYTNQGLQTFPVAGIFSDYASTSGIVRMEMSNYRRYWGDSAVTALAVFAESGVEIDMLNRTIQDVVTPIQPLAVRPNLSLRNEALVIFDRTFAITRAMQLLATLIAFIGILSTLLSLQIEKQRQMGVLRAVGLTVQQLWGLVFLQTGIMGALAGLLALPTGYILSLILVYIINRRSFGWTLQMNVVPAPFFLALFVALAAALLAGIYPAWRLGRMVTTEALRGD